MKHFEAAIVQAGFDVTDFDARQLLHLPRTKEVMPNIATVVVRRISPSNISAECIRNGGTTLRLICKQANLASH